MLKVQIDQARDFTSSEKAKLLDARALLERILNSEEFKLRVINHTYKGAKTYVDNGGLSNELIYAKIMTGAEVLKPDTDYTMNIDITIYTSSWWSRSTIGYTYPDTMRTWINRRHYSYFTPLDVCGNILHEYLHKLGFGHAFNNTSTRRYSVPYAIGYLIDELSLRKNLTFCK